MGIFQIWTKCTQDKCCLDICHLISAGVVVCKVILRLTQPRLCYEVEFSCGCFFYIIFLCFETQRFSVIRITNLNYVFHEFGIFFFLAEHIFFSLKYILGWKTFWVSKSVQILGPTNFGSEKILGPKSFWVKKSFWVQKYLKLSQIDLTCLDRN